MCTKYIHVRYSYEIPSLFIDIISRKYVSTHIFHVVKCLSLKLSIISIFYTCLMDYVGCLLGYIAKVNPILRPKFC